MAEKRRKASVVISPAALPPARHMPLLCSHLVYKNLPQTHRQLVPHRRRPHLFSPDHTRDGFRLALQVSKCLSKRRALRWDLRTQTFSSCTPPPPRSIHPRPQPHEQRETRGQASFRPLGMGCPRAGGMGTGVTTPNCPQREGAGAGQDGASPHPGKEPGVAVQHQKQKP